MSHFPRESRRNNLFQIPRQEALHHLKRRDEEAGLQLLRHVLTRTTFLLGGQRREDAEDLAHEVVLAVYRGLEQFRRECSLRTWVDGILAHKWCDYVERRTKDGAAVTSLGDFGEDDAAWPCCLVDADSPERVRERRQLLALVRTLPAHHRAPMLLSCEGFEQREIAEMLGIPTGTVNSRVRKGRELLLAQSSALGLTLGGSLGGTVLASTLLRAAAVLAAPIVPAAGLVVGLAAGASMLGGACRLIRHSKSASDSPTRSLADAPEKGVVDALLAVEPSPSLRHRLRVALVDLDSPACVVAAASRAGAVLVPNAERYTPGQ